MNNIEKALNHAKIETNNIINMLTNYREALARFTDMVDVDTACTLQELLYEAIYRIKLIRSVLYTYEKLFLEQERRENA